MKNDGYMPRLMDGILKQNLEYFGAILIEGCKWCGKSTTARQAAKSAIELQDPRTRDNAQQVAKIDPDALLDGEKPRLIDEWQDMPAIWDAIRYDVDKSRLMGQYILTGSVTPRKERPRHSGAGRFERLTMRPMSLFESRESNGSVRLCELFEGEKPQGYCDMTMAEIAHICTRGGWPSAVVKKLPNAGKMARSYLNLILRGESGKGYADDDIVFSPEKMRLLIRSLARNTAMPVTMQTIKRDMEAAGGEINNKTLGYYFDILERMYILDDVEPWSPQLRSRATIRAGVKRNFVDPSLVVAALRATENDLRMDFRTFGLVAETMILRDLKVYAQCLDGEVYYYRDNFGRECDATIHLSNGKWGAIEIKLGGDEASVEAGAKSLKKFVSNVDTEAMREPAFLMVVTAKGGYAYRREDGVLVVPVGCLRD